MLKQNLKTFTTCLECADFISTGINLINLENDINSIKYHIINLNCYNLIRTQDFIKSIVINYNISYTYVSFDYNYQSTIYSLNILLSYLVSLKNQTCVKTAFKHIGFSLLKIIILK